MRSIELLEEETPEEAKQIIERDCQPFLKKSKGLPIFRGTKKSFIPIQKIDLRPNRSPKDTELLNHVIFDYGMKKNGFIARRSNSVFATGDMGTAMEYGNVFQVYPIGKFNFTWSPNVGDFMYVIGRNTSLETYQRKLWRSKRLIAAPQFADYVERRTNELNDMYTNWDKELADSLIKLIYESYLALSSGNTTTILKPKDLSFKNLKPYVDWKYIDKLLSSFKTENLSEAINSGCEIMINCESYYLTMVDSVNISI